MSTILIVCKYLDGGLFTETKNQQGRLYSYAAVKWRFSGFLAKNDDIGLEGISVY